MNISLPSALEQFVASQVESGEFNNASAVVSEGLRLLRERREEKALEEMRAAMANVDSFSSSKAEPTPKERALIDGLIKGYRAGKFPA